MKHFKYKRPTQTGFEKFVDVFKKKEKEKKQQDGLPSPYLGKKAERMFK
jgi:hypothetical protein